MSDGREKTLQQVAQAIRATDAFIQSTEWNDTEFRRKNQIQLMRRHLADMLASLEIATFQPVKDLNMGWVIVDSWPRAKAGEEASALADLGTAISLAEQAYQNYARRTGDPN